ncbi:unnamed protein product, partial [Prorocentrum cordatum]
QEAADRLEAAVRDLRAELGVAAPDRRDGPHAATAADAHAWRRDVSEPPQELLRAAPAPPAGDDAALRGGGAHPREGEGGAQGPASGLLGRTGRASAPADRGRKSGRLTTISNQGTRCAPEVDEPWVAQSRPLPSTASWDAELAMTVSRSSESEASESRKSRRCIQGTLNPEWTGRLTWDLCVLLLVTCDSVVLPFQLAAFCEESSFDVFWLWSTTFFFLCDLVMNFFTAYPAGKRDDHLQEGELVTEKLRIMLNYLRGWFWIDFMSTVPWTVIADGLQSGAASEKSSADSVLKLAKVVKLTRLLRLMRMLRLWKLSVIWERLERQIGSITFLNVVSMLKVLGTWTAICHWGACIWWMFGKRDSLVTAFTMQDDATAIHWTELERVHSAYDEVGQWRWVDRPVAEQYVFCFYWILGVMRTMPAEVTPVNLTERMFVLLFMFFAVGAFAVNIARITQAWFRFSARKDAFKEEMACARMHLREIKCGPALQLRAESYFHHLFQKRRIHAKELSLLSALPEGLRRKLSRAHMVHYLRQVPEFQDWAEPMLARVCDASDVVDYLPGDKLTQKDQDAEAAYVLTRGFLQIFGARPAAGARLGSKEAPRRLTVVDEHCLFTSKAAATVATATASKASGRTQTAPRSRQQAPPRSLERPQHLDPGARSAPGAPPEAAPRR